MKIPASGLILLHAVILLLWIMNSGYLFSKMGIAIWISTVAVGFIVQKQLSEPIWLKNILLSSSIFMVFLCVISIGIFFVTSSMP